MFRQFPTFHRTNESKHDPNCDSKQLTIPRWHSQGNETPAINLFRWARRWGRHGERKPRKTIEAKIREHRLSGTRLSYRYRIELFHSIAVTADAGSENTFVGLAIEVWANGRGASRSGTANDPGIIQGADRGCSNFGFN